MHTITNINEARLAANITARAQTLTEKGYTYRAAAVPGLLWVTKPTGREYMVDITPCGSGSNGTASPRSART